MGWGYPQSLFISYSRKDAHIVHPIVQKHEDLFVVAFLDVKHTPPGANWLEYHRNAISVASRFALCWSRHAATSKYVEQEWRFALKQSSLEIIPVLLDDTPLPTELAQFNVISLAESTRGIRPILRRLEPVLSDKYKWLWLFGLFAAFVGMASLLGLILYATSSVLQTTNTMLTQGITSFLLTTILIGGGIGIIFECTIVLYDWIEARSLSHSGFVRKEKSWGYYTYYPVFFAIVTSVLGATFYLIVHAFGIHSSLMSQGLWTFTLFWALVGGCWSVVLLMFRAGLSWLHRLLLVRGVNKAVLNALRKSDKVYQEMLRSSKEEQHNANADE